ncbi:MAG: hypothetical protein DRP81_03895 [Candidatus Omnitrophota bacterium]|nr:MAG: hypothetical protein DRP81_03895 [Candidatus Omnitrophota bacterium]
MRALLIFLFSILCPFFLYAEKITVLYTGNTYATIYPPGDSPASVGGGITRRAFLIKKLRQLEKNILLLDAGNFSAGSPLDEHSMTPALDKRRTQVYLKAMEKINYDAVLLGEGEFAFGPENLKNILATYRINFISSNLKFPKVRPYLLKKVGKIKVAILGLTYFSDAPSVRLLPYQKVLRKLISRLKRKVDLFLLLSNMPEDINKEIVNRFPQIKVIISTGYTISTTPYQRQKDTIILRPSYQGKDLRIAELTLKEGNIENFNFRIERLPLDLKEDAEIKDIIPQCFASFDCGYKEGVQFQCVNPGTLKAYCKEVKRQSIEVVLVTDFNCPLCAYDFTEAFLNKNLGTIRLEKINYQDQRGKILVKKYNISTLPAFIFPKEIEKHNRFSQFSKFLDKKGDAYLLKTPFSGIFLFLGRKPILKRIDLFANLYDEGLGKIVEELRTLAEKRNFSLNFHPIVFKEKNNFIAKGGLAELEEIERLIALKILYPEKFWFYLTKRLKNIESSWWPSILDKLGIDYKKIKDFIKTEEETSFLEREFEFQKDLGVNRGITILVDNKYIFGIHQVNKEDLDKLINYVEESICFQ